MVFDRRVETPFGVTSSQFDFLVAVLNHNAVDFVPVEVEDVLGLTFGFLSARLLHLKEPQVGKDA